MADTTLNALRKLLNRRFAGVLTKGKHQENGQCCALEALSVLRGVPWTDEPSEVRSFDLRPLNDLDVSDEVRTKHLLPVIAAYDGSLDWPKERQQAVATALAIGTVNVLIAELACLPAEIAKECREAKTREEAESSAAESSAAAWSARSAAASSAAWSSAAASSAAASAAAWSAASAAASAAGSAAESAAESAASAARSAAWSAASAARSAAWSAAGSAWSAALERVFIAACRVWLDAAKA